MAIISLQVLMMFCCVCMLCLMYAELGSSMSFTCKRANSSIARLRRISHSTLREGSLWLLPVEAGTETEGTTTTPEPPPAPLPAEASLPAEATPGVSSPLLSSRLPSSSKMKTSPPLSKQNTPKPEREALEKLFEGSRKISRPVLSIYPTRPLRATRAKP